MFQAAAALPQTRISTRPSSRKASRITSGVSPARMKNTTAGRVALHVPSASAPRWPKRPAGPHDEHQDEEHEVEHFLPRGADGVGADDLDRGDDQRCDQRAGHVAQSPSTTAMYAISTNCRPAVG